MFSLKKIPSLKQRMGIWNFLLGFTAMFATTSAFAMTGSSFPLSTFFCDIASALQSNWAPGIILICIIVEGFLFLIVKKGIMQMLMMTVLAATVIFGAASLLNLIKPGARCVGTKAVTSLSVPSNLG